MHIKADDLSKGMVIIERSERGRIFPPYSGGGLRTVRGQAQHSRDPGRGWYNPLLFPG